MDDHVVILKLFPGISEITVRGILEIEGLKAVILETYGTGNAPNEKWMLNLFEESIRRGLILLNITQCEAGSVIMGKYETSVRLMELGVISGADMTTEAAVTKLMYLLGNYPDRNDILQFLAKSLVGELSLNMEK
jgi:L-asparaginase